MCDATVAAPLSERVSSPPVGNLLDGIAVEQSVEARVVGGGASKPRHWSVLRKIQWGGIQEATPYVDSETLKREQENHMQAALHPLHGAREPRAGSARDARTRTSGVASAHAFGLYG